MASSYNERTDFTKRHNKKDMSDSQTDDDADGDGDEEESGVRSLGNRLMACCRGITVEPIAFFYQFAMVSQTTVNNEYIIMVYDEEYIREGGNITSSDGSISQGEVLAATNSAAFITIISLLTSIPPLFTVYFYGAFSDLVGRKPVMLIPLIGNLLALSINLLIVHYGLTTNLLLLTTLLVYGSGGHLALETVQFAYLCDITPASPQRTSRFLYIKVAEVLALLLGQIVGGELITYCGYFYTILVMFLSALCSVLFTIFCVTDSQPQKSEGSRWKRCSILKKLPKMLCAKDCPPFWRLKLFVHSYIVAIQSLFNSGGMVALMLFLVNPPVSMSAELIAYYLVEFMISRLIGILFIIYIQRKRPGDYLTIGIGLLSALAGTIGVSIPYYKYVYIFIVPFFGFASSSTDTVCRSAMSKLVSTSDQGTMSAWATLVAALGALVGATLFPYIYSVTFEFYVPTVFCVASAIYASALLLDLMLYLVAGRGDAAVKDEEDESYTPLIPKMRPTSAAE